MSCTVISPPLHVLQHLHIVQITCPAKVISCTLYVLQPAQWANYMSYKVISTTLHVLWTLHIVQITCPTLWFLMHSMYCKPCPVGKLYVLRSDFPCTSRIANPAHWANCMSYPVISSTLYIAQNPARWENYMSYLVISPTLYILESLPHWENSMSGQWFILRFKIPENLPIGQILCPTQRFILHFTYQKRCPLGRFHLVVSHQGKAGGIRSLSALSSLSSFSTVGPLPSPPLRLVSPSERASELSRRRRSERRRAWTVNLLHATLLLTSHDDAR
jgi:hypothetical protein